METGTGYFRQSSTFSILVLLLGVTWLLAGSGTLIVEAYPSANVNLFSPNINKLDDKMLPSSSGEESAEQSFHQFINQQSAKQQDSTLVGELKPNSSTLDMILFKDKIAKALMSMQEMERVQSEIRSRDFAPAAVGYDGPGADCYIETTKVERIAGKCHKVNNGLPVCQSNNYMAINMDCS